MKLFSAICLRLLPVTALAASGSLSARADQAIVVGVNQYTNLRPGSNLEGCVNDAKRMKAVFEKYGFNVTLLADRDATKAGVLGAIKRLANVKPDERIAFYFAGHGTLNADDQAVILPSDATENGSDITNKELYEAIKGIEARSRTIILDSCHSGGMTRAIGRAKGLKSRAYIRKRQIAARHGRPWQEVNVNSQDNPDKVITDDAKSSGVCYYTACMSNEVAAEKDISGVRDGVFTFGLSNTLTGKGDLWQDIAQAVNKTVGEQTEDLQHPTLSPAYLSKAVFDDTNNGKKPKKGTLFDIYNTTNPDETKIAAKLTPALAPIPVGAKMSLNVATGADGYLLVLGRDPKDEIYVIFPRSMKAEDAQVHAGEVTRIPKDLKKALVADTPGSDRIKAFLFTDADKVGAMLKAMGDNRELSRKAAARKWNEVSSGDAADFYTSEISSEIVPAKEARAVGPNTKTAAKKTAKRTATK